MVGIKYGALNGHVFMVEIGTRPSSTHNDSYRGVLDEIMGVAQNCPFALSTVVRLQVQLVQEKKIYCSSITLPNCDGTPYTTQQLSALLWSILPKCSGSTHQKVGKTRISTVPHVSVLLVIVSSSLDLLDANTLVRTNSTYKTHVLRPFLPRETL